MTDIQNVLIRLLDELDEICKNLDIKFALTAKTAVAAHEVGGFCDNCCDAHIMMLSSDMHKLIKYLHSHKSEGRACEDVTVNPDLALNVLRYVDTNTLYINRDDAVIYKYPGICVTVHPLYPKFNNLTRAVEVFSFFNNCGAVYNADNMPANRARSMKLGRFIETVFGKKILSGIRNKGLNQRSTSKKLMLWRRDGKLRTLQSSYLNSTERIAFENLCLPVSVQYAKLISALYGANSENYLDKYYTGAGSASIIVDADISYSDYCASASDAGVDINALRKSNRDFSAWTSTVFTPVISHINRNFQYTKLSIDRIDLYVKYLPQMEFLNASAENQDFSKLELLMADYIACIDKYYKKGKGFYISPELHRLAGLIYENNGKKEYFDKVTALVPEVFIGKAPTVE